MADGGGVGDGGGGGARLAAAVPRRLRRASRLPRPDRGAPRCAPRAVAAGGAAPVGAAARGVPPAVSSPAVGTGPMGWAPTRVVGGTHGCVARGGGRRALDLPVGVRRATSARPPFPVLPPRLAPPSHSGTCSTDGRRPSPLPLRSAPRLWTTRIGSICTDGGAHGSRHLPPNPPPLPSLYPPPPHPTVPYNTPTRPRTHPLARLGPPLTTHGRVARRGADTAASVPIP